MKATIKEIKTESGIRVWVCILNGIEIARFMSLYGLRSYITRIIRRYKQNGRN